MRILNSNEQDLCRKILNGNGNNNYLGNIIDHRLGGVCISVTMATKYVELVFTIPSGNNHPSPQETEIIIERISEISIVILETVNLINMLEKEVYIMLLQKSNNFSQNPKFGGCVSNMPSVTNHFADQKICDLLIEYINKEIYITEEFREFCNHGYIARDERRFRRQNSNATIAISVAMFAAFTNLFFNTWTKISDCQRINKEQFDTLITTITKDIKTSSFVKDSIIYDKSVKRDTTIIKTEITLSPILKKKVSR